MTAAAARFLGPAINTTARVLGLSDRDAASVTYGCCDRNYWHYKIIDVANARFQEAGLLFALAYATEAPGNPFFRKARILEWSRAAWRFWLRQRNRDGSLAEVYPNERSFCATAFSAAAFVESVALLGGAPTWTEELGRAQTTMDWLARNDNPEVGNQMAASLLALTGYARLTGNPNYAAAAGARRKDVLAMAQGDGTLPEYGGRDLGYQTISLAALARVLRIARGDAEIEALVRKGLAPVEAGLDADGRADPAKNSRGTQFIYPSALAALGSPALERVLAGLAKGRILRPVWMDDRYCIAFASDYWLAFQEGSRADVAR
ncbi:MAG TPA: hypothetical protein VI732_05200 [Alphaproteobacteria bacterium]|jgi:hypothetical protein|nr:hypothetical protein [Alphaproteobacteria bacterium]